MATKAWQPMSDEEFERRHQAAVRRGQARLAHEPLVVSVVYENASGRVVVDLNNDCVFMFPANRVQGLCGAAPELLAEVAPSPSRLGLHWKTLDAHFSLAGLMDGVLGSSQWMAELAATDHESKPISKPQKKEREVA